MAQLNYFHPAVTSRFSRLSELTAAANHCDGFRCDMAMLILNDIFVENLWSSQPPASRPGPHANSGRTSAPHCRRLILLAEAYWGTEGRLLLELGFPDFTYDKNLYDALARPRRPSRVRAITS